MIVEQIEKRITAGTVIPKPEAKDDFTVKGWGKRRGEKALIYRIPNHKNPKKPHEKGVTISEWDRAYSQLQNTCLLTGEWFKKNMTACAEEGYCNFTTIGGIFELLGFAEYRDGVYTKTAEPARTKISRQVEESAAWGARINSSDGERSRDCPTWATPAQREQWQSSGLVMWNRESRQVTRLSATHALGVLDELKTSTDWKDGVVIGEPATRLVVSGRTRKPEPCLVHQIELSGD